MLGKRSWPAVGRLTGPLRPKSGLRSGPLDHHCKMKIDHHHGGGGIGLGIVVALDKSASGACTGGGEIIHLAKHATFSAQFLARSSPIPVGSQAQQLKDGPGPLDEEFTYVTCRRGPNKSATTRVYYDRGDGRHNYYYYGNNNNNNNNNNNRTSEPVGGVKRGVLNINSPAKRWVDDQSSASDFLSSCNLCRKGLHGKDIYMYRGEKAFCSAECRERQITIDERKERCRSEISRSNDVVSTSPCCTGGQIFSAGIIAV